MSQVIPRSKFDLETFTDFAALHRQLVAARVGLRDVLPLLEGDARGWALHLCEELDARMAELLGAAALRWPKSDL